MAWRATQAKAQFSEVLDRAESEGLQVVERRKKRFVLMTEEELKLRTQSTEERPFVSAWDALAPSSGELFDVDFPRLHSKPRIVKF